MTGSRMRVRARRPRARPLLVVVLVMALAAPGVTVFGVTVFLGPLLGASDGTCQPALSGPATATSNVADGTGRGSNSGTDSGTDLGTDGGSGPLVVHSNTGMEVALDDAQRNNARTMIDAGRERGASDRALLIMLMTALQESKLRNLANPAVPTSLQYPNDGEGYDHDSIGVMQQRPSMLWGDAAELMDPGYAASAFLGGPDGPNGGAPPGLFDLDGWENDDLGVAAQRVQVSAFPDAYDQWFEAAVTLLDHVGSGAPACTGAAASGHGAYPLAAAAPVTDGVGPRPCRVGGAGGCASSTWHPALDFGAACGEPVLAARPGTVTVVSDYWVSVTTSEGTEVSYLHMFSSDVIVSLGDVVSVGQRIGAVGNAGPSTGCHLDFRVNALASSDAAVTTLPHIGDSSVAPGFVDPVAYMAMYGVDLLTGPAT